MEDATPAQYETSLEAPHFLGAPDDDPVVELSGEMKEVSRTMSHVFSMPDEDAVYQEIVGLNRAQGYVDTLEEPINPHDAMVEAERHTGPNAPERASHMLRGVARLISECKIIIITMSAVVSGSEL
jgi:hypothetical protein